jgi:hypothetical protein
MRVYLDIEERQSELFIVVTGPGGIRSARPVTWVGAADKRLLVAKGTASTIADPASLADAIDDGRATDEQLKQYGRVLFEAAFGQKVWQQLLRDVAGRPYLELAIRGLGTEHEKAMQTLRWEALHDGSGAVAAVGTSCANFGPGSDATNVAVGIVRLVHPCGRAGAVETAAPFQPIDRIPRVLFAIGSRLTDAEVRPGAEFMGIMRRLDRGAGSIHPKVLQEATPSSLIKALQTFRPDVVHFIGHGRRSKGAVKLQLRPEPSTPAGDEYVSAEQVLAIFGEAGHTPKVVILSACQTASADPDDRVNALPFAARLVAGGVPVVFAMAGDIADTACRIFTRALTAAIAEDATLGEAVIWGRRAAFHKRPSYASAHWILPTVFLAEGITGDVRLVDTTVMKAARNRVERLGFAMEPVFCGRADFITAMDRLLDGDDPLNVLVACTPDETGSYGGERLLRELGARAIRGGVLPILLAPFDQRSPTTRARLSKEISNCIQNVRGNLAIPAPIPGSRVRAAAADPDAEPTDLAIAIRADLDDLVADLPVTDPVRARPGGQPRVVLLCHRVDGWDEALFDLLDMLGPPGLQPGSPPLPVVLTGADTDELKDRRLNRWHGKMWVKCAPLGRFSAADDEDVLAYQWWLLNPPEDQPVYAPKRDAAPGWQDLLRTSMEPAPLYPGEHLYKWAQKAPYFFTSDSDDALLASYAEAQAPGGVQ